MGRLLDANGKDVGFTGGETAEVDAAIWATGYKDDSRWVAVPEVKDADGAFVHQRGVSTVPGLYFIGRSWQWMRGSALLHGVGDDASYLIGRIAEQLDSRPTAEDEVKSRNVTAAVAACLARRRPEEGVET